MMIVNVPIEPIEHRYSKDWYDWFELELKVRAFGHLTVVGEHASKLSAEQFLDPVQTNKYKASQIHHICSAIESGHIPRDRRVVFLIHDGWFPVEQIAYMRDMLSCYDWKIVGLFHAGTYDPWDQLAQHKMYTYGEDLENAWFRIYDRVVVGSNYHRSLLCESRNIRSEKIRVIPWKVEVPKDLLNWPKGNIITFPHRMCPEKQVHRFYQLQEHVATLNLPYQVVSTEEECTTKRGYYSALAGSKIAVSFSLQETFGIAMREAVLLGCIPLVPDRLSYPETFHKCFRYRDNDEFEWMLNEMCVKDNYAVGELGGLKSTILKESSEFFNRLFEEIESV